ncbi:hypothetical protein IIA16_04035 [bacterium]|nr:hypothetical protein [bacterium]
MQDPGLEHAVAFTFGYRESLLQRFQTCVGIANLSPHDHPMPGEDVSGFQGVGPDKFNCSRGYPGQRGLRAWSDFEAGQWPTDPEATS